MIKLSYLPKEPTQLDLKISLEWLFPKVAKLSRALTYFWNGQRYNLFCILYAAPYYLYCCALGICRSSLSWFRRPLPNSRSYRVGHSSQYFHFRLVFKCSNFWTFRLWLFFENYKSYDHSNIGLHPCPNITLFRFERWRILQKNSTLSYDIHILFFNSSGNVSPSSQESDL